MLILVSSSEKVQDIPVNTTSVNLPVLPQMVSVNYHSDLKLVISLVACPVQVLIYANWFELFQFQTQNWLHAPMRRSTTMHASRILLYNLQYYWKMSANYNFAMHLKMLNLRYGIPSHQVSPSFVYLLFILTV